MARMLSYIEELERVKPYIESAEKSNKLLVYWSANIIFTPEMLIESLRKNEWVSVDWDLVSKKEYGEKLREKVSKSISEYDAFVKIIESA